MAEAFIIGGTGQIGLTVAARLAEAGWAVRLGARSPAPVAGPWTHVGMEKDGLPEALGDGADLVVDCIAFDGADADRLVSVKDRVGRIVAVSSASVYADPKGRSLDEARQTGFPDFPVPIPVGHPTVAPGPRDLLDPQGRDGTAAPYRRARTSDDPAALRDPWPVEQTRAGMVVR